jgi:lambda family phage portal protein
MAAIMQQAADWVAKRWGSSAARAPIKAAFGANKRKFDAAQVSRLTFSMARTNTSLDYDLLRDLDKLRAASRDQSYNNDYIKKFLQLVCTHVVGPNGFSLQVQAKNGGGNLDERGNAAVEAAFYSWCQRGVCDVTGKLSFLDIQALVAKAVARDGEVLIRKVYGPAANAFGFGLQMLDIDRLDTQKNEELANGNIIVMGVEQTRYGKPVAYWLRKRHPGAMGMPQAFTDVYDVVPADEIYHLFLPDRAEQTRGFPWAHAAMTRLQNLHGFEEAAIIAARVGAAKMGFFTTPDGNATSIADGENQDGDLHIDAEPGEFKTLPEGVEFTPWDPQYPHAHYESFIKSCLRGVASGLGVAYHTLASDLEGVNFSSMRGGTLEERDQWMVIQSWMIESFLAPLYKDWLRFALLNQQITFSNGSIMPLDALTKFSDAGVWQGRRWQWVDPIKDVEAATLAIEQGFKTRKQVIAEMGLDIEDVWAQLAKEKEKSQKLGLELGKKAPAQPKGAGPEPDPVPA